MPLASARPSKVEVPRPISSISTRLCGVALCRICAASVISSMKVDCALARSSAAPMRVWIASIGPRRQADGRHVGAHAGQQHDQCHLPHVGRFAAHVGAGDDLHALLRPERRVIGDEAAARQFGQPGLHHRVAALADLDAGLVDELRRAPVQRERALGQRAQRVQRGQRARQAGQGGRRRPAGWSSNCSNSHFSRASARSWALSALSSKVFSSGVMKRSAFFSVWRRR